MMSSVFPRVLAVVVTLVSVGALAQSTGTVQVRVIDSAGRPLDGTVTFRSGNATQTCRTVASRCSIALAPGSWSADVAPAREASSGAQTLSVRAGSVASVTFRTRAASAPAATTTVATTPTVRTTTTTPTVRTTTTPTVRTTTTPTVRTTTPTIRTAPGVTTTTPTVATTPTVTTPRATGVTRTTQPRIVTAPGVRTTTPASTQVQATTTPRIVATAPASTSVGTTTPATPEPGRDLSRGSRVCAQGTVSDAAGRPADATVTVSRDGAVVGTVRSVAGRFSMFDLPPGRYVLRAVAARDARVVEQSLALGAEVARVVVRIR
jgi:hypothetical protein